MARQKQVFGSARVHHTPAVHHDHAVTKAGHHVQIVADHQQAHATLAYFLVHDSQHLGPHHDVEGRCRLVGDHQAGRGDHHGGDHHALADAAGELVRVGVKHPPGVIHPDRRQHLQHPRACLSLAEDTMQQAGLRNLPTHPLHRVEGELGILQDHGNAAAADIAPAGGVLSQQVDAVKCHPVGTDCARFADQAHDGPCRHGLARARLTHDADPFRAHLQRQALHDVHRSGGRIEAHRQVVDEQLSHVSGPARRAARRRPD